LPSAATSCRGRFFPDAAESAENETSLAHELLRTLRPALACQDLTPISSETLRQLILKATIRPILIALLSGAGLLLLIGFVNGSSLLLVRAEGRRREVAVRGALGASRARLVRQFAVEGFLLAVSGCGLGLASALLAIRILPHQIPRGLLDNMPYLQQLEFNSHLALFAVAVSILGGALFSATAAMQLFLSNMQVGLMEGGRTAAGRSWRKAGASLVVVEYQA